MGQPEKHNDEKNSRPNSAVLPNKDVQDAPPPYDETRQTHAAPRLRGSGLQIPPLSLSRDAGSQISSTVTPDQCAAHLKFLAVLADLCDSISSQDGLFGIADSQADNFEEGESRNEARAKLREKRWNVYISKAVNRFFAWWVKCLPQADPMPTISTLESFEYMNVATKDRESVWARTTMPPIGKWNLSSSYFNCIFFNIDIHMLFL